MKNDETSEESVSLLPLSPEEITMIKKVLVSGGKLEKGQEAIPFSYQKAVLKGKQFVMSVPASLLEELNKNYLEALSDHETQEEGENQNEQYPASQ